MKILFPGVDKPGCIRDNAVGQGGGHEDVVFVRGVHLNDAVFQVLRINGGGRPDFGADILELRL
jgi:hypothetical protein